jgi:hypothetical protein
MRDFKEGDLVVAMSDDKERYQRGRVQWIGANALVVNDTNFLKGDAVPIKYEDQHAEMVHGISDSKAEMLASGDANEAIDKMMEDPPS